MIEILHLYHNWYMSAINQLSSMLLNVDQVISLNVRESEYDLLMIFLIILHVDIVCFLFAPRSYELFSSVSIIFGFPNQSVIKHT